MIIQWFIRIGRKFAEAKNALTDQAPDPLASIDTFAEQQFRIGYTKKQRRFRHLEDDLTEAVLHAEFVGFGAPVSGRVAKPQFGQFAAQYNCCDLVKLKAEKKEFIRRAEYHLLGA